MMKNLSALPLHYPLKCLPINVAAMEKVHTIGGKPRSYNVRYMYMILSSIIFQVFIGDQVVFESIKSPGQYLHVSRALFPHFFVYSDSHELGLSVRQSGFSITRQKKPVSVTYVLLCKTFMGIKILPLF